MEAVCFYEKVVIYLQVHTALKPRKAALIKLPNFPQQPE
jgi:hypothetical protein